VKSFKKTKAYQDYVHRQVVEYGSFESESDLWEEGQKRFVKMFFSEEDRQKTILDIACGDGVGLRQFRKLGFNRVVGVEFNPKKKQKAAETGYRVYGWDMHNLCRFRAKTFDIVYSSHTLEHAYDIKKVVGEIYRVLKDDGKLVVVLPYPDRHQFNLKVHIAKKVLGTDRDDDGKSVVRFFYSNGLRTVIKKYDYFREPEIWLVLKKRGKNLGVGFGIRTNG